MFIRKRSSEFELLSPNSNEAIGVIILGSFDGGILQSRLVKFIPQTGVEFSPGMLDEIKVIMEGLERESFEERTHV